MPPTQEIRPYQKNINHHDPLIRPYEGLVSLGSALILQRGIKLSSSKLPVSYAIRAVKKGAIFYAPFQKRWTMDKSKSQPAKKHVKHRLPTVQSPYILNDILKLENIF